MNDNKKSIHCPYCGHEMIATLCGANPKACYIKFACDFCGTETPRGKGKTSVDAKHAALVAAMKFYEEPNRVLTFAEIDEINKEARRTHHQSKPLWIERRDSLDSEGYIKIKNWGIIRPSSEAEERKPFPQIYTWVLGHPEIGEAFYAFRYNTHWRCWLREPTEKELKETPWEDEKNVR